MTKMRSQRYGESQPDDGSTRVSVLSAGAAEPMVARVTDYLTSCEIEASFAPVGVIREALMAGVRSDLFITSAGDMDELRSSGHLVAETVGDVGWVNTVLAVRTDQSAPDMSSSNRLAAALHAASGLFVADPVRSTAGRHIAMVLDEVGVSGPKVHTYPNGATAMLALAEDTSAGLALGCTQATEVRQTSGVRIAGALPAPYDLATRYQCALLAGRVGERAEDAFELLTGSETAGLRERLGLLATPRGAN